MQKKTIGALLAAIAIAAGVAVAPHGMARELPGAVAGAAAFDSLSDQFLDAYWRQDPEHAIQVGFYRYADRLPANDAATRAQRLAFVDHWLKRLRQVDARVLDAGRRTDLVLLENQLRSMRWYQTSFRSHEWNPSDYNVASGFARLLAADYAPLDARLATISTRLAAVPAYYAAAKRNIRRPTREHTELAIVQNQAALDVFGADLDRQLAASGLLPADKERFRRRTADARAAIADYVDFLKRIRQQADRDGARPFRIGKALYEQKFAYDIQSDMPAGELYRRALAEKERLHGLMDRLADELWPVYLAGQPKPQDRLQKIGSLIDRMSERHVSREAFLAEVRRQIPLLEKWVTDHDLLTLDPSRPLVVRATPAHERGVALASVDAPGPYDPTARTYYNVQPLDGMSDAEAESLLREYNEWILQILNAHEAVPGHYVQLLYANKSPSRIKTLFGNGAMIEGWAVYSERMMLESGYGGNTPEMWLMYAKWNLRVVCNAILDYRVHVLGMSREEATALLTREAFQSDAEAAGKWRRVSLTSVQLASYFTGYAEIYDFREQLRQAQGERFRLKEFHERFLGYGSAPVGMIKRLMAEQD